MAGLEGPFEQTRFLGASIVNFSCTAGWNEQQSTLTVQLVEDKQGGDRFQPPGVGEPVKFEFGDFKFEGIMQYHTKKDDREGSPIYEVQVTDPREILDGAQVILSGYKEPTAAMPNLLNVYGYWEDKFGFGGSLVNESGMLWDANYNLTNISVFVDGSEPTQIDTDLGRVGLKVGIEQLTSNNGGLFGAKLSFRGHEYSVDLSGLPTAPPVYRLGGVSRSILSIISELCSDAGHDYMIYLDGDKIKVKVVSRREAAHPSTIKKWIATREDVVSKSIGVELRNDVTNAVLLGGDVQELVQVVNYTGDDTIWPFWGSDVDGNPIVGQGMPEVFHQVLLNSEEIADIIGDVTYHCTIPELRCALANENAFDSWAAFVIKWYPVKAKAIGLVCAVDSDSDLAELFPNVMFQRDMIAQRDEDVYYFGRMNESDYWTERAQRVFDFVRRYASEYFGRRFWVKLPFNVNWKFVPETTLLVSSEEPSDGGYVHEGGMPLGLPYTEIDKFLTTDGRFECFVSFPFTNNLDIQRMSHDNVVIANGRVYVRATVDTEVGVQYPGGSIFPHCCVVLSEAIYPKAPDPLGGVRDIARIINVPVANIIQSAALRFGSYPLRIHPAPLRPTAVAIPMKSNRMSYGPWGTFPPLSQFGVAGKVYFERDETLTPWEYGDWETMIEAGNAKLQGAATNMQESEFATVELAGVPMISLGDTLVSYGPTVTSIRCAVGTSGLTTTYEMRSFTPAFGAFSQKNAERLKRMGVMAQSIRRTLRSAFHKMTGRKQQYQRAAGGFMQNTSRAVRQMSPHECIYGTMTRDEKWGVRTQVSTATLPETLANMRGDTPTMYAATGACSLEALYRPFSTDFTRDQGMPHYWGVDTKIVVEPTIAPSRITLDPFGDYNDIDIMIWGDQYSGIHTIKGIDGQDEEGNPLGPEFSNARLMGLRGPLVIVGYGYDVVGKPFPNANVDDPHLIGNIQDASAEFMDEYRSHPEGWKAGPVDLRWDRWRSVWTVPTILKVKLETQLSSNLVGTGRICYKVPNNANDYTELMLRDTITVHCWQNGVTIPANTRIWAQYYPIENRWYVTSASCVPDGSVLPYFDEWTDEEVE